MDPSTIDRNKEAQMITLLKSGEYLLIETKKNTKILYLDDDTYAWVEPPNIGEILVVSHQAHKTDCILATGKYHFLSVEDEPELTDVMHLELEVGHSLWQGYLLLTGLPTDTKKRARIVPTHETITGNPQFGDVMFAPSVA